MGRDRGFIGTFYDLIEPARGIENANGGCANSRPTTIVSSSDPVRIASLVEFPKRLDTGVHAFRALQQFTADAQMGDFFVGDDSARDGDSPLGVICGLPNSPLALRIADISGNDRTGHPFELLDPIWIPT